MNQTQRYIKLAHCTPYVYDSANVHSRETTPRTSDIPGPLSLEASDPMFPEPKTLRWLGRLLRLLQRPGRDPECLGKRGLLGVNPLGCSFGLGGPLGFTLKLRGWRWETRVSSRCRRRRVFFSWQWWLAVGAWCLVVGSW